MNLHAIVRGVIPAVNPDVTGQVYASTGSTTLANGKRVPAFATPYDATMQVQPLSAADLKQLDALNIEGVERAVYLNGVIQGVNRQELKGGDKLVFLGRTWLVTVVMEPWNTAGWCKIGVTAQVTA